MRVLPQTHLLCSTFWKCAHMIVLPWCMQVTNHAFELHNFPWEKKLPVAFGRAAHNYDHSLIPDGMTTRAHLAIGSMKYPER